jgi:hypothetical protein
MVDVCACRSRHASACSDERSRPAWISDPGNTTAAIANPKPTPITKTKNSSHSTSGPSHCGALCHRLSNMVLLARLPKSLYAQLRGLWCLWSSRTSPSRGTRQLAREDGLGQRRRGQADRLVRVLWCACGGRLPFHMGQDPKPEPGYGSLVITGVWWISQTVQRNATVMIPFITSRIPVLTS